MTVKRIELLQYTSSKDIVRYHAVSVDENDNIHECMIDSCVYNRAKTQAQHVADACGVQLYDKTCHSDLFNARTMAEAHALMQKEG